MADLWAGRREAARRAAEPLAERMRPRTLAEFAGQRHLLGEGKLLRRMVDAGVVTSLILHGPPGTGKTTLASLVASHTKRHFERENASSVGVKRVREIADEAGRRLEMEGRRTVLFLDEIHRFSRAQQDVLLADVERGVLTLIGATTENPLFSCNSALVSRSTLLRLEPLDEEDVVGVLRRAIGDRERGLGNIAMEVNDEALRVWARKSDGDVRRALSALELAAMSQAPGAGGVIRVDRAAAEDSIQQKAAVYDGTGDEHYDSASALIKSLRGSDPDAALYWLARMLEAGEDPRFIARRMAILASEDIGNADPRAVVVAHACWSLVERIGMPEARLTLAQCATYLALAHKSNASCAAIEAALEDVREGRTVPVPLAIRDPNSSPVGEGQRVGGGYQYTHSRGTHVAGVPVTTQDLLGAPRRYYQPGGNGEEVVLRERLEAIRRWRAGEGRGAEDASPRQGRADSSGSGASG